MTCTSAAAVVATLILCYVFFRRVTRPSLSRIRGPRSPSFVFGNLLDLFQRPIDEADFVWQRQYGNIVRFKSVFGEDRLLVADPEALRRMLNTSAYTYTKLPNYRVIARMLYGNGLLWADGDNHRRQRSIMLPGLGLKECKAFLPVFQDCAEAISMKWLETIGSSNDPAVVMDVVNWMSRGSLDAIGHAAFDVQFGAINDDLHPLAKKYKNFLGDVFGMPPAKQIFMQAASKHIPTRMLQWLVDNGSSPRLVRARDVKTTATGIARELIREKADALLQGKENVDIFTLLVKANMDANAKRKLTDEELLSQMRTLLIAGYETTSTAISFVLLELARNPNVQSKLREEIRKTEATVRARADPRLTLADMDAMPYLNAVIKEGLRFHPPVVHSLRIASQDDLLPLSKPIRTTSGEMIDRVLVPKGTEIVISIAAYNRDKDLWGEDAHAFNPDRWLDDAMDDKKSPGIGVYANLMTFYSGTRACLGWRFALIEIQTFLCTLVSKFAFGTTDKSDRLVRLSVLAMIAMVEGELDRGVQLPLAVSLAPQDGEM